MKTQKKEKNGYRRFLPDSAIISSGTKPLDQYNYLLLRKNTTSDFDPISQNKHYYSLLLHTNGWEDAEQEVAVVFLFADFDTIRPFQ